MGEEDGEEADETDEVDESSEIVGEGTAPCCCADCEGRLKVNRAVGVDEPLPPSFGDGAMVAEIITLAPLDAGEPLAPFEVLPLLLFKWLWWFEFEKMAAGDDDI